MGTRVPNLWRYIWCIVTLRHFDPGVFNDGRRWRCKRCRCEVKP